MRATPDPRIIKIPANLPLLRLGRRCGRFAVGVLLVAALATACGGGEDPADAVRAHFVAIVDGDGQRACDQLSDELRRDIERATAARGARRSCADVFELAAGLNPDLTTKQIEDLEIDVEENGDDATARLRNPLVGRDETINLVRHDEDWRISTLETRPPG
jgi:hypothetical protein